MICINCFHVKTHVTNSRPHKTQPAVWRRRRCLECSTLFTSYERPSLEDHQILDHTGQNRPFSFGKLHISIARSFQHNKHAADYDSYPIAQTVEAKLLLYTKALSTDDIAATVHTTLHQFDPIAALQYAAQHDLITLAKRPGRPSVVYAPDRSAQP